MDNLRIILTIFNTNLALRMRLYHLLLPLFFFFSACQKEVQVEIPTHESQLVVDGRIETGLPPILFLSTTKDIFSDASLDTIFGSYIDDATVIIFSDSLRDTLQEICSDDIPKELEELGAALFGVPSYLLSKYHICAYSTLNPLFFGQTNKEYSIEIHYNNKIYTAKTSIPNATYLDSVYWKPEKSLGEYGLAYAQLSDPAETQDNYFWEVMRIKTKSDGKNSDSKFYKPSNPVFNDAFINGLSINFWYENPRSTYDQNIDPKYRGYYKYGDTVIIKFSKINTDSYTFLNQKYTQINSGGSPFSTPINIPSTITGGALGSFIGYSTNYNTLICK